MSEPVVTKRCPRCKRDKPADFEHFFKNKSNTNGLSGWCKICHTQHTSAYKKSPRGREIQNKINHSEKARQNRQQYKKSTKGKLSTQRYRQTPSGQASAARQRAKPEYKKAMKRYRDKNPIKRKARQMLASAVRRGDIPRVKTLRCACGKQAQEYHHWLGYEPEHWYDVIPMCHWCHHHPNARTDSCATMPDTYQDQQSVGSL